MTHRPLSTPNTALRVFSASLLSALLIMMPFVQLAAAQGQRLVVRGQRPESERQAANDGRQDRATNAAENVFLNTPIPKPAPEAVPALAPAIAATKDDGISLASTVNPGDTITYTVNIANNGATSPADDATNVVFSDTIDAHTTLVANSPVAAVSDRYNTIGNTQISVPDGSTDLLGNDFDPPGNNTGMTVTAYGATTGTEQTSMGSPTATAQGGSVTVNGNGSFTYDPPLGFEGTDTFKYRAADADGFTAITTVRITIAGMIWFINNNAGACTSSCDGRLSHPFQTLAAFQAVNNGTGNNPAAGDSIFLYESATDYVGPVTLLNNQKFIGQDATASLASITGLTAPSGTDPFPAMNATPATIVNITSASNAINLGQGNTLRGFTVGNTTGIKINGNNFGTLIVGNLVSPDVTLNGTGQALNLTTGTLSVSGGFVSVTTTSSSAQGISLAGVADDGVGPFSFGSTTVSGSTTQGILVGTTTADINFGNVSVSGGTDGISFQNNSSGTRTIGTLSIQNTTQIGFVHAVGGGLVNVTGATTITNPGTIGISVDASTSLVSFGNASVSQSGGAGVSFTNNANANGDLTFSDLDISPDANQIALLTNSNNGTITATSGTIVTSGASALSIAATPLALVFDSITASGGTTSAISLTTASGSLTAGSGSALTGNATIAPFFVSGGSVTVTYSGNITQASNAAMVNIQGGHSGPITFQTGTLSATNGTGLQFDNADGTYNFNATTTMNGGDAGIDILNTSIGTFTFGTGTSITRVSGNSGTAFNLSSSNANVTYSGGMTLPITTGGMIAIDNHDGGTMTFQTGTLSTVNKGNTGISISNSGGGTIHFNNPTILLDTGSGNAVSLTGANGGGTMNFTPAAGGNGIDITTSSGVGFNATGGGTVVVTGSGNTITSTTGTALNVANTTIGASGLTFLSISANGASSGIVLNATGASGGLTVTGNGGTCSTAVNCTGGAIQNTTSHGISLTNTMSPSFDRMFIQNNVGSGVRGDEVTNFTFTNGFINNSGTGGGAQESSIAFNDPSGSATNRKVSGNVTITGNTLTNARWHGVSILQFNGTLSDVNISNNTLTSGTTTGAGGNSLGSGIQLVPGGVAATSSNVTRAELNNNTITNFPGGVLIAVQCGTSANSPAPTASCGTPGSASNDIEIKNNILNGGGATVLPNQLVLLTVNGRGQGQFTVQNNGTVADPMSGSAGNAIDVSAGGDVTVQATVTGNQINVSGQTVSGTSGIAAGVGKFDVTGPVTLNNSTLYATVNNNVVTNSLGSGIRLNVNEGSPDLHAIVKSNTVGAPLSGTYGIQVQQGPTTPGTIQKITNLEISSNVSVGGSSGGNTFAGIGLRKMDTTVGQFAIVGLSPSPATNSQMELNVSGQNPGSVGGNFDCDAAPPFLGVVALNCLSSNWTSVASVPQPPAVAMFEAPRPEPREYVASADTSEGQGRATTSATAVATEISQARFWTPIATVLTNSATEAGSRIAPAALSHSAEISSQRSEVTDQKSEIRTHHAPSSKLETRNTTRDEQTGLRAHYATLSKLATRSATAAPAPLSGETVTANIGTLPAGGSATITFQVTVNNPPNLTLLNAPGPRVENQGSVSYDFGTPQTPVLTDDPETGTAGDKTATRIDLFNTTTTLASNLNPSNSGDSVTFTATVNETPAQTPNPAGTVDFIDTNNGNAVICNDVVVTAGSAQCITAALSSGTHDMQAVYSGDGNFEGSNSNIVSQVVVACTTNPIVANANDTGAGSLRQAILDACSGTTIDFAIDPGAGPHTITLTTGELALTKNVTIQNTSGESVTVSGSDASRVFNINAGKTVTITNLTITDGAATTAGFPAGYGGGIFNAGTLNLNSSTVKDSVAKAGGGGIYTGAGTTLNITSSTISGNSTQDASTGGGGIIVDSATATIINSTISGNSAGAGGQGGGIHNSGGTTTITNSTIAENTITGGGSGGGINTEGGGATVNIGNTIVGNNAAGTDPDVRGTFNSQDYNLIETVGSATIGGATTNNKTGQDPVIGLLANNGGPTFTHRILGNSSPAMDAGNTALTTDQRGQPRPKDNLSVPNASGGDGDDIGAYEAPLPPNAPDLDAASDTGSSNTDDYTSDNTPTFTINGVETGAFVELLAGATVVASGTVSTLCSGFPCIQLTSSTLADGLYSMTARQTVAGGLSPTSTGLNVTIDTGNPGAPTIDLVAASDSGSSSTDDITNAATRTFDIGNTETGATVELLRDGNPITSTTGNGGTVQLSDSTAAVSGTTYAYTARQTDGGGNQAISAAVNVVFDNVGPTVNMTSAASNPTNTSPIPVSVTFNESVNGFTAADITPGNATVNNFAGSGASYTFDLVPSGQGTVTADISAAVAQDTAGNDNSAATQFSRTFDTDAPTADITDVTPDPRNTSVSSITIVFTEAVTGFDLADLTLTRDANPVTLSPTATLTTSDNITWTLGNLTTLTGTQGTYVLTLTAAGSGITDNPGNALAGDATDSWVVDTTAPTVTINQAGTQSDPTSSSPINFTVVFSEAVTGFTNTDVTFSGAGATTATVTEVAPNDGTTYNVAISGMNADGTVQATVNVNAAQDGAGNNSAASTSTDNQVTFVAQLGITVHDAKVAEPGTGSANLIFTVSLSSPAITPVTVDFTTSDGTAKDGVGEANQDYTPTNGQVSFAAGQQVRTIHVPVLSDSDNSEVDETLTVTLSNPSANSTIADGTGTGTITVANPAGEILISELRTSGPAGTGDDFVELYNNSNSPKDISGYGLFKKGPDCVLDSPVRIAAIPGAPGSNTTVIPPRGHYLLVGSQYSLANYGGSGAAAGNYTLDADIETDGNVALFSTADPASISTLNRVDAVGFGVDVGGTCDLLREGSTLPPIAGNATTEHSYFRKLCEWIQGSGCTLNGQTKDTNNNSVDFWLADTGAITGRLGAPGPENLASPIRRDNANNPGSGGINVFLLDGNVAAAAHPNRTRDNTSGANPVTFGTMTLRYRVTNNTGGPVTRLRYRIVDISTAVQPAGPTADLRALGDPSTQSVSPVTDSVTCTAVGSPATPPCTVVVQGTTLEQPPNQPNGGGYNSTLASGTVTTGNPLADGASIPIYFKLGVNKTGQFRFFIIVEALP